MKRSIRVVIADDSPFVCQLLKSYLHSDADISVVGIAFDGLKAVELIKELQPDAVTLDLEMPKLAGMAVLEIIMRECPTPVIIISGISRRAASVTLQALDAGAIDFILKYRPGINTCPELLIKEIIRKVHMASQIRVIRSLSTDHLNLPERLSTPDSVDCLLPSVKKSSDEAQIRFGIVVIGASTGGPIALRELLSQLPADFTAAILIVQHMPPIFTTVLAAQLDRSVSIKVKEAEEGDRLSPGIALISPGDYHMLVDREMRISLNKGPEIEGHRPSIDVTMQSISHSFGALADGVLLTGMGKDGAMGLLSIHAKGGKTYAQDAESCVVNSMPNKAVEMNIVDHIGTPKEIAQLLIFRHNRSPLRTNYLH